MGSPLIGCCFCAQRGSDAIAASTVATTGVRAVAPVRSDPLCCAALRSCYTRLMCSQAPSAALQTMEMSSRQALWSKGPLSLSCGTSVVIRQCLSAALWTCRSTLCLCLDQPPAGQTSPTRSSLGSRPSPARCIAFRCVLSSRLWVPQGPDAIDQIQIDPVRSVQCELTVMSCTHVAALLVASCLSRRQIPLGTSL